MFGWCTVINESFNKSWERMQLSRPGFRAVYTRVMWLSRTCLPRCLLRGTKKRPSPCIDQKSHPFQRFSVDPQRSTVTSKINTAPVFLLVLTEQPLIKRNFHNSRRLCISPVGTELNEDVVVITSWTLAYLVNCIQPIHTHDVSNTSTLQHVSLRSWMQLALYIHK